jgi:hypothetical protein
MLYIASHQPLPFMKSVAPEQVATFVKDAKEFIRKRAAGEIAMDAQPPARPQVPELDAIKRYLDLGGTIVAVAEGGGRPFADSVERAALLMYPQYEWHDAPDTHWAYMAHVPIKTRRPPLKVLSNGVRDLIILSPSGDLPAALQTNDTEKKASDFATLSNLYFYASELNRPRARLESHAEFTAPAGNEGSVTIVRAVHEGNWKPEPAALNVFAAWLKDKRKINVAVSDQPLASIGDLEPRPALVIVSGTERAAFSDAQKNAVRKYVDAGGVILFETPGGGSGAAGAARGTAGATSRPAATTRPAAAPASNPAAAAGQAGEFTLSAEEMAAALFQRPIESIGHSRIITGEGLSGAANCSRVEYRPFALQTFGSRDTSPRLQGLSVAAGKQPQVIFSREDFTHGVLNQPCWGIIGYSAQSARDLLGNILQHAMAGTS